MELTSGIVAGRGGRTLKVVVRLSSLNRAGPQAAVGCAVDTPAVVRGRGDLVGFNDACITPDCASSPEVLFRRPVFAGELVRAATSLETLASPELIFCRLLAWSPTRSSDPVTP